MRSLISITTALVVAAVMLAPSLALLEFQLRRSYIERELCVQRDVAEGMRTCHGECQLSKRLKALEREAERGFPAEDLRFREFPMVLVRAAGTMPAPAVSAARLAAERPADTEEGHARSAEHVPWC